MAAAYRSEQRRLLSFIRMSDFKICDTLHTILLESIREILEAIRPAVSLNNSANESAEQQVRVSSANTGTAKRSLQSMDSLLSGSRRQRVSAALAAMQLVPISAAQQAAGAVEAAGTHTMRTPVFELEILLSSNFEELLFKPEPDQLQVGYIWHWSDACLV